MVFLRALLTVIAAFVGILLAIPIVVLGFPFWMIALLTRVFCRLFEPRAVRWQQVIELNPIVGWKPKANLDTWCRFAAGMFHVKTDAQGWSGKTRITESDVVVFGDSFAFGFGVNAKAMFAELDPNLRIKAIGAPGYNMVQELIWMRELSPQLRDKLVVWLICVSNDLYDNLLPNLYHYRMPFVRATNKARRWEVVTSHVSPATWPFSFEQNFRVEEKFVGAFAIGSQSQRTYSACEFLIGEGKSVCDHAGARLVVMTIPWIIQLNQNAWRRRVSRVKNPEVFDVDLPDKKLGEICDKLDVLFIAGKDHFGLGDYIVQEGHWNEKGHQRMAKILEELYHLERLHFDVTRNGMDSHSERVLKLEAGELYAKS